MTRLGLRRGLTLQPVPGGGGHFTDSRTGDSLRVPAADFEVLSSAGTQGLDPSLPEVAAVLERYQPFYVDVVTIASFSELNLDDAPTALEIPSIAPIISPVTLSETEVSLKAALDAPREPAAAVVAAPAEVPSEAVTDPGGEQPGTLGQYLSQEENLRQAMETQPSAPVTRPELAALFGEAALAPAPRVEPTLVPQRSSRPVLLTVAGIVLLGLGVVTTWLLRPEPNADQPAQPQLVPVTASAVDAVDASTPEAPTVDAGQAAVVVAVEPVVDAGQTAVVVAVEPVVDAGPPVADSTWLTAEVQSRGRVKMGEVVAGAGGALTWTVEEGQRVKGKQALGTIALEGGGSSSLIAPSVGLALLKQPSGSDVKPGAVVAEIIYFEAWAKGFIKGKAPTAAWRCEVVSASANTKAECRISVVTPKSGGAVLTVAIEPRWFDEASDAVLRVSP